MKKALIAIILFTLLLTSFTLLSAPQVKADASEVKVLSYSWYSAPVSSVRATYVYDLIVVGEVQNVGSNPLDKVFVTGGAYNASDGFLGSAQAQVFASYLLPGQKAPFYLDFTPEYSATPTVGDETWTPFVTNVTVNAAYVEDSNLTQFANLVFPSGSLSGSANNGVYTLTGTVQNAGAQATGNVWVVSTFYNGSGTVVGLNYTNSISSSLAPGNVARFTATPIDNTALLSSSITNYTALIQSAPLTIQTTPTPTPYQQPTATPTSSIQPTQSPVSIFSNQSSTIVIIGAIIAVVIVAIIITLLLFRKRQKTKEFDLPPPPPPPP